MGKPQAETLNDQAAAWFSRLHGADVTAEDRAAFDRWMEDPANVVAYVRVEATWERTARLQATGAVDSVQSGHRDLRWTRRAAATALLTAGAGAGVGWRWLTAPQVFKTAVGERKRVRLSDDSVVDLNTASELQVRFARDRRAVRLLTGEALFQVAKDPKRPFIVSAGQAQVRAIGTAFNVRLREHVVEVTVTEGVVQVDEKGAKPNSASQPVHRIAAGAGAVVGPGAIAEVPLDQEALLRRVAWQEGVIELRGETLEQAVAEFNRYRTEKLVVGDPDLAGLRIGGTFETDESEKFLAALRSGFNVRTVEGEGGTIYLLPAA